VIFTLSSSHGRAEREAAKRLITTADIYCQAGPLSVIVIP
jgi:hypothetical protein